MHYAIAVFLCHAFGCASAPVVPQNQPLIELTDEEKRKDPVPEATQLIEEREKPGKMDHAIRLLQYHVDQHPESGQLHELLAEVHARSCETLQLSKSEDRQLHREHRTEGIRQGEKAVTINPESGPAHYWLACNLLHAADAEKSVGRAKDALKHLDQAERLSPKLDEAGPARLRGKVLADMPGLFGGSTSKAIASYRRSLELFPDCITTHLWLAQAYLDAKNTDLARKELEWVTAAKAKPGHEKEDGEDIQKAQELLKKLESK
jgi:tetratricopeptide (TPR) repeat protein